MLALNNPADLPSPPSVPGQVQWSIFRVLTIAGCRVRINCVWREDKVVRLILLLSLHNSLTTQSIPKCVWKQGEGAAGQ